jgi:Ala-tRNA(Pro) deacylase
VVVDRDLALAERVSFHPNINTVTLTLTRDDFERFLAACGNPVSYVDVEKAELTADSFSKVKPPG